MLQKAVLSLGIVLGFVLAACDGSPRVPETAPAPVATASASVDNAEVAARYGGRVLMADELAAELKRLPRRSRELMNEDGRRRFVENRILHDLLFEEALRKGLDQDPEIRKQVDELNQRLVVQKLVKQLQEAPPITDEEIEAYYLANQSRYSTTTLRARHILVRDEDLAKEIHEKLEKDPDGFANLAKEHSVDSPSARKGGDLGFFGYGRMVPAFEEAAFALREPGDLSDVIETQYGYHVILLEERREGQGKTLAQVRDQIRANLTREAVQKNTQDYYAALKEKADIQIDAAVLERVATDLPEPSPGAAPFHRGAD